MSSFKSFRIGDIFEISTGSLVSGSRLKTGTVPRISAKSENNGVIGYFSSNDLAEARHFENFITVNFFGADGGVFYHPYRASIEMKVHVLQIPNCILNRETGLYIATAIKKAITGFSYGSQLSSSKLKEGKFFVELPITKTGEIDFAYMEKRIRELELARIRELELARIRELDAYLKVTGLIDYELTKEDKLLLKKSRERGSL